MRYVVATALNAADTASVDGAAIDSNQLISASFQAIFGDATAAGTVKVQFSNDHATTAKGGWNGTPTNWTDIPSATATVTSGVCPGILIPVMAFRWIRVVYTRSGGGSTAFTVNMMAMSV